MARAADVYIAYNGDGSAKYASQRMDSSYSLLFRDAPAEHRSEPSPATAVRHPDPQQLRPLIERAARRHGVAPALVEAVVRVESGFNALAVSSKGARGAMQLMPATGREYGLVAPQLASPEQNIDAGVRYLKDLLVRNGGSVPLALAAYNAGPGAVQRHGARIPPYRETMLYVPAVLSQMQPEPGR